MRLRLLVEIRAAALADIHTRERQETRWRQNIHTGAAVCPAFIRKHWEVCCMKIMDKAAGEEQNGTTGISTTPPRAAGSC